LTPPVIAELGKRYAEDNKRQSLYLDSITKLTPELVRALGEVLPDVKRLNFMRLETLDEDLARAISSAFPKMSSLSINAIGQDLVLGYKDIFLEHRDYLQLGSSGRTVYWNKE